MSTNSQNTGSSIYNQTQSHNTSGTIQNSSAGAGSGAHTTDWGTLYIRELGDNLKLRASSVDSKIQELSSKLILVERDVLVCSNLQVNVANLTQRITENERQLLEFPKLKEKVKELDKATTVLQFITNHYKSIGLGLVVVFILLVSLFNAKSEQLIEVIKVLKK